MRQLRLYGIRGYLVAVKTYVNFTVPRLISGIAFITFLNEIAYIHDIAQRSGERVHRNRFGGSVISYGKALHADSAYGGGINLPIEIKVAGARNGIVRIADGGNFGSVQSHIDGSMIKQPSRFRRSGIENGKCGGVAGFEVGHRSRYSSGGLVVCVTAGTIPAYRNDFGINGKASGLCGVADNIIGVV